MKKPSKRNAVTAKNTERSYLKKMDLLIEELSGDKKSIQKS